MQKISNITGNTPQLAPHAANLWRLDCNLNIWINFTDGSQWHFEILKGFITDLRSGDNIINRFVPKSADHTYNQAVILHDANYTLNCEGNHSLSRKESDELLERMIDWASSNSIKVLNQADKEILSLNVSPWKTSVMKWALRLFGGSHWETKATGNSKFVKPVWRSRWKM